MPERKIRTFSEELSLTQAEKEKHKGSKIGESLKKADDLYDKRRRK